MIYKAQPIKLSQDAFYEDNSLPDRVQLLRVGTFYQGLNEVKVSERDLESMVKNFSEKVRGIDLMIDFSHNSEGEAAAWIKSVFLSEDKQELWAEVHWTPGGKNKVLDKEFRYISADFSFNYVNNETLHEYGPTLFGAGLTNRPVVKNMEPVIELSEKKEYQMEEMLKQLLDKLSALEAKMDSFEMGMKKELEESEKEMMEDDKKEMEEMPKEDVKMSEDSEKLEELKKENELLKKTNEFNKLFSEGKVVEAQREAFMNNDMVKFSENAASVKFNEVGNQGKVNDDSTKEDVEDKIIKLAEEKKTTFSKILAENPDLAKEYNKKFEA